MLVNVTNDGWFGDTVLPHQHAWLSVLRATENRVPLIRVANNGVSFAAAPSGRILQRAGLFERDAFVVAVTPNPGGSFYTRHGNLTLWVLLLAGCSFLLLVELVARRDGR